MTNSTLALWRGMLATFLLAAPAAAAEIVSVKKIWDAAPHNAFTDLIRHNDRWLCTFREGAGHVSGDGKLRVITSADGEKWESLALIESKDGDLRDPKISLAPNGNLMIDCAMALPNAKDMRHRSFGYFSADGVKWDGPFGRGDDNYWLWRSTWHKGQAYIVGYQTLPPREKRWARLYRSDDGHIFEKLVDELYDEGEAGESTLRFRPDGTALCLLRHETAARLGTAKPPYTEWKWQTLNDRVGGPNLLELPDGRLIAAGRFHKPQVHTALAWLDAEKGTLTEFAKFPSGGDCSYPGLVLHDGQLWVSYYSSHEGKTSIYLAKVAGLVDDSR
jgi:hypothetical protein